MNEDEFSDEENESEEEVEVGETASAFTLLENEYKSVLSKMQDNEDLMEYAEQFTKLFEAFYQTYSSEKELLEKCADMENTIAENMTKIEEYEKLDTFQRGNIADLTEKLSFAHNLADNAHAREQQAQEVIENMRIQIVKLNTELEMKSKQGTDDGEDAGSKTKEGFEREKQRLIDEIFSLKQKLANLLSYSEELEHKNSAADLKAAELNGLLEVQASESSKKQRMIEKLESELATMNSNYERQTAELDEANNTIEQTNRRMMMLENQLRDQKLATEKAISNGELIQMKLDKCRADMDALTTEFKQLKERYDQKRKNLKLKESECLRLINDFTKLNKQKDNCEKKCQKLERLKYNLEQERDKLRTIVEMNERQIAIGKKQADLDKRNIENLVREKEILHKNIIRVNGVAEEHMKLIKLQEQSKRKLESDINQLRGDVSNFRKELFKIEKEKNRAVEETMDLTQQVEDAMDEIKLKQQAIYDYKKIIAETQTKLRQQQNLFEAVRADRNAFQKALQETTAEVSELKSKLKISNHQSEQLKEDIAAKEALLVKEENILRKVNKEKENLKVEVQTEYDAIIKLKEEIDKLLMNEKRLMKFLQENETTMRRQAKDLEQIMNDRDVIGAQLVRRNDEIGLLYEKINILQITLHRGEAQYEQRIEDIRILKLEIRKLRQEKNLLSISISNMTDLKHEVFTLERELAQERLKCRALEEELQHPMNIHRWRKLEGSDPEILDLLHKIQILQKRLLNQHSESIDREKQLKESEKLYLNLRQVLARQPGPEIKNQLIKTQKALALRGTKMKCLVSELNMYENQSMEYKMDLERVQQELKELKKKYLKQKKINETIKQAATEQQFKFPAIKLKQEVSQKSSFGGGFKMAP